MLSGILEVYQDVLARNPPSALAQVEHVATYILGVPYESQNFYSVPGEHYKVCWAYNPKSVDDFNVEVSG